MFQNIFASFSPLPNYTYFSKKIGVFYYFFDMHIRFRMVKTYNFREKIQNTYVYVSDILHLFLLYQIKPILAKK